MSYAKHAGRSGRVWRRLVRILKEQWQRDNLPCALCHQPIDFTLTGKHPMAFSADHIIPLSTLQRGDPLRQNLANLQGAHNKCNSSKGDGTNTPQTAVTPRRMM